MKAIVLVGGLGTRLRPLTFAVPKPLLAVGDKPILQLIIEQLREAGCCEIILATGYLAELIEAFGGDGARFGVKIRYVKESCPLGTAGPISLLREVIGKDEFFILMNGDIITRLNFADLINFACRHDYDLTVGYVRYTYQSPFGVLTIDRNSEVAEITEKPAVRYCVSGGIYVLKGSTVDYVPDKEFFTMPHLIEKLRSCNRPVGAFHIKEFWLGVEDLSHIEKAREVLNGHLLKTMKAGRKQPSLEIAVRHQSAAST
ncbi:MAG: NTP transferase domain-containing protein [Acidobacteria bacterium]|nr:NTP transferase domain-containing protein [Acidobacteriota bacterium]MCI0719222.1 NTP transferase domain-containing protein [Acidobacteriota bacterium]